MKMELGKLTNSLNLKNIYIVVYSYHFKVNWGCKLVNSTILNKKDNFLCRKQKCKVQAAFTELAAVVPKTVFNSFALGQFVKPAERWFFWGSGVGNPK